MADQSIPKMSLNFDPEQFPQICKRYTPDGLRDILLQMCLKGNLQITEKNMYSQAAVLESDLAEMFS